MLHQLLCILVRSSDLWPGSNNDEACSLTYRQAPRWIISIDYFMACWCHLLRETGEWGRGEKGGVKKWGKRRREAMGCLVKGVRISPLNPCSMREKDKTLTPSITTAITLLSEGKNQWLTAFNQSSALGRSIQKKGAQQGGPYRSVFTYAVKHYFTVRITISISQCHSLFKHGESIQPVSFLFSCFHCGQETVKGWRQYKWYWVETEIDNILFKTSKKTKWGIKQALNSFNYVIYTHSQLIIRHLEMMSIFLFTNGGFYSGVQLNMWN